MKKIDTLSSLVLIVFGLIYAYASLKTGMGRINAPGSGLIPFGTAVLLVLFGLGTMIEARLGQEPAVEAGGALFRGKRWGVVVAVLVSILAYALLLGTLGYVLTTFLILIVLFKMSEGSSWTSALAGSGLTTAFTYLLFIHFLRCSFPKGFLGF
jgi:putative tricarboxylic transport membrane protein